MAEIEKEVKRNSPVSATVNVPRYEDSVSGGHPPWEEKL